MFRVPVIALLLGTLAAVPACSGATKAGPGINAPMGQPPEPRTEAVLVGPLCHGEACRCKTGDDQAGAPAPGEKRYEVHLGPSDDPLWATVDGMVLYKDRERADSCYYIDLAPGKHQVALRGKADDGALNVAMAIAEQGGGGGNTWWYSTFDFNCGAPGQCTMDQIQQWKEEVARWKGKHDPCGSTKVGGLSWETGRMPDRLHPDDLLLHVTLDVYKFTPQNPPGSSACDRGGGGTGEGGAPDDPGSAPEPAPSVPAG